MLTQALWTSAVLLGQARSAALHPRHPSNTTTIPPINSTQPLCGPDFIGHPSTSTPLPPQTPIHPEAQLLHQTSGNQGYIEFPGPLGHSTRVTSYTQPTYTLWWTRSGAAIAATTFERNGTTILGICSLDATTLEKQSCWAPADPREVVNFAYSELLVDSEVMLLNAPPGNLYVVGFEADGGFSTRKTWNLTEMGVLGEGEEVTNSLFDVEGNVWFTSGKFASNRASATSNSSTVGYITPNDTVHTLHLPDAIIENGIAVSDTTMFIQTGPAGANDHANATANVYAFQPGSEGEISGVNMLWNATYDAGSSTSPGGFARGSGTSATLLGHDYVALTDHADIQLAIKVYNQTSGALVCSVPVFAPHAGASDNGILNAWDGTAYGLVVQNDYNVTKFDTVDAGNDIDGAWNDMIGQAPGFTRVDVEPQPDGTAECSTRWDLPLRVKGVSVISTKAGMVYAYVQDEELAKKGEYVWYMAAVDFASGEEAWRVRTGTGGNFNDGFQAMTLSPDGRIIQGVQGGTVVVEDGAEGY